MSGVIIFVSSGLFVYWLSRTNTLLDGSDTEIEEMLAHDLWLCRNISVVGALGLPTANTVYRVTARVLEPVF
jgi:hypothetical protein